MKKMIINNRVRTKPLLQREGIECGAAALGIILKYYGRTVSLTELRHKCGISRDGTNAMKILQTARSFDLIAKGFHTSVEGIKNLKFPCIIFWNFNHFLVLEGFDYQYAYLNDPATGRKKISIKEFSRSYSGIALQMMPGEHFQKGGDLNNLFSKLKSRLENSYNLVFITIFSAFLLNLTRLIIPAFSIIFVDEILVKNHDDWLRPLLLGMIITGVFQGSLARLQFFNLRRIIIKLSGSMNGKFIWHILHLPTQFYLQRMTGEITDSASINNEIINLLSQTATTIVDVVMLLMYVILMAIYDWKITLITVVFTVLNLIALLLVRRFRVEANLSLSQEKGKLGGFVLGSLQGIETIKAGGIENFIFSRLSGIYSKIVNSEQKLALQTQVLILLPTLLAALTNVCVLVFGGYRVMEGSITLGMLVAYQSLVSGFLRPVNKLVNFAGDLQKLESSLERIDDILNNPIDSEFTKDIDNFSHLNNNFFKLNGKIELHNLTFGYNQLKSPLIENFNLTIRAGERVALVGQTGSGKSTIAKVVCGFYQPWSGEVCFDGIPSTKTPRFLLANSLAMVEQDIFLFAETIRDNLTLWDSTIDDSSLIKACQDAAIYDFIMSLPQGFDTKIHEEGINLSGGQRQRLEIARALVKNPVILVLDEATSSLDVETERVIVQNLRKRGCSCLVIAHRLSTIHDCDEIIVLDQGKVVERGTHQNLLQQGKFYSELLHRESGITITHPVSQDKGIIEQVIVEKENLNYPLTQTCLNDLSEIQRENIYSLKNNQTITIDDINVVWILISGTVNIFYSNSNGQELIGNRRYLFEVGIGEIIFGMNFEEINVNQKGKILVVSINEAQLMKISYSNFISQINDGNVKAILQLETWFHHIGKNIINNPLYLLEDAKEIITVSDSNQIHLNQGQYLQSRSDTIVWVKIIKGNLCGIVREKTHINNSSSLFPLVHGMVLQAEETSEIMVLKNTEIVDFTHININYLNQYYCEYLTLLLNIETQKELEQFKQCQTINLQLTTQTMRGLASIISSEISSDQESLSTMLNIDNEFLSAVGAVARAMKITISIPNNIDTDKQRQDIKSIEAIAKASNFRIRKVTLKHKWWQKQNGPLLAFIGQEKNPVALLLNKHGQYCLFAPTDNIYIPINKTILNKLAPEAIMFYRPFPRVLNKIIDIFPLSIKGYEFDLYKILLFGGIATLLSMVTPQATALLVNHAIPDSDILLLWQLGLGLLAVAIGKSVFELAEGIISLRVETAAQSYLQPAIFDRLLNLTPSFFRDFNTGDLLSRLLIIDKIRSLISDATRRTIFNSLFSLLNLGIMLIYSRKLTFIVLWISLIIVVFSVICSKYLIDEGRKLEKNSGEVYSFTTQLINGVRKIRIAGAIDRGFSAWGKRYYHYLENFSRIRQIDDIVSVVNEVIPLCISAVIFWFYIGLISTTPSSESSGLNMGTFLAFNAAMGTFISSITSLSNTITDVLGVIPLLERAKPILFSIPEIDLNRSESGILTGNLNIEKISFRYGENSPLVLNNISLYAKSGEFIAIVGPSGSGKSTLFRLLLGFNNPSTGEVYYDQKNLSKLDLQAVRQQLGVVLQNGRIVYGSVYDNITCGGLVSIEDAWESAKLAGLAEDIRRMPMGMHTVVSEAGANISVGQRQRLLIARALINKPKILLFDEATSALDNKTQALVANNLKNLKITRVVIAHRLSTIRNADRIYVFSNGSIVQIGTFSDLIQQEGLFAQLASGQMGEDLDMSQY